MKIQAVEEQTTAGILLPSTAVSKPQGGEVVGVGEGRTIGEKKIEVDIQVGLSFFVSFFVAMMICPLAEMKNHGSC